MGYRKTPKKEPTMTAAQTRRQDRKASQARMEAARREAQAAWDANTCPECGQDLHRNLALTGWVQCQGYGAEGFRKAGSTPCSWQGFTA